MAKETKTGEKIINLSDNAGGAVLRMNLYKFLETRALIQASSGGGKSWLLRLILEQTMRAGVPVWLIDPEGEYVSLREKFDVVVFGEDGDLPIDENTLSRVLPELLRLGVSAVFDLSELRYDEQQSAVVAVAGEMMKLSRPDWKPFLLAVDEAQRLAPEGSATPSMTALADVASRGRKRGFGLVIATQRLSALDKNITTQLLNRFIGLCLEDVEIARAARYIGKKNAAELMMLEPGDFFALGSALTGVRGSFRFHAGQVETTHPDSTVHHAAAPVPQASGEFAKIITELRAKLQESANDDSDDSAAAAAAADKASENGDYQLKLAALNEREINLDNREIAVGRRERKIENLQRAIHEQLTSAEQLVSGNFQFLQEKFRQLFELPENGDGLVLPTTAETLPPPPPPPPNGAPAANRNNSRVIKPRKKTAPVRNSLSPGEQAILTAVAQYSPVGASRDQLSILTGYKRSTRDNYLQRLRQHGLVEISNGSLLVITEAGSKALPEDYEPLPTGAELRRFWLEKLAPGESLILGHIFEAYPKAIDRDTLSEKTTYKRSTRDNYLQRLIKWKLVVNEGRGMVRAAEDLF